MWAILDLISGATLRPDEKYSTEIVNAFKAERNSRKVLNLLIWFIASVLVNLCRFYADNFCLFLMYLLILCPAIPSKKGKTNFLVNVQQKNKLSLKTDSWSYLYKLADHLFDWVTMLFGISHTQFQSSSRKKVMDRSEKILDIYYSIYS